MVFENVVADLLNRFLGSYIDNLNASQLNIGIWGGDVKLNNLDIKETALDDLDLPVRLKFGYVQSLVLKIPWKYLYTEPTIVNISELFMIIVPNQGIVYDEQKAKKNEQEAKQKKLARLEENRLKQNVQKDDTFTEKLVAQIIKNLQIRIKRVHLRYEDKFSNRGRPFATGVTLDSLNFQTTDENFQLTVQKEAVKIFYKLVSMNHLSIYSNAASTLISDLIDKKQITNALCNSISTDSNRPEGYKYVLEPLSLNTKLKLNQKPETDGSDWTIPKIDLILQLEKLALAIGKFQYQDFLLFLEAQERFNLSAQYFKYRPNLIEYKNHYKEWWNFAFNCIINEHVKRRRNNWSWKRMKRHRKMVRDYKEAWIIFRTEKSPDDSAKETIEEVEEELDVFNLNIARQQAEFEIDRREDLIRVEDQKQEGWVGWAKSWFVGSGKKAETEHGESDAKIMEKIDQAVTPEEKQRLFEAIDYQENTPPTDYPKHFVENRINFSLLSVVISLENVLEMRFADLTANLDHRPSANAIKYISCIKSFEMNAYQENQKSQSILKMTDSNRPWLKMKFETNPLNNDFDQLVELHVAPIMLMYHAPAFNKALDVFKPPETVRLQQLTALAIARYEEVKARSTTALQHMVEQKRKLKLEIQIDPATIVLCSGGVFDEGKTTLVAELGQLNLNTKAQSPERAYEKITDLKLKSLMAKAYDNFQLSLSHVQLIFADTFRTCMKARADRCSPYHLLKPTNMVIDVLRSTIDDLQLPMIRVFGNLPDVVLIVSDDRLVQILELLNSIPRPEFDEEVVDLSAPIEVTKLRDRAKMVAIMEVSELDENILIKDHDENEENDNSEIQGDLKKSDSSDSSGLQRERQIQFDITLSLNEVGIVVNKRDKAFLSAHIRRLGFHLTKRMFDMIAKAHLGSLTLEMPQIDSSGKVQTICLIDNEMLEGDHLIDMVYKQATGESPSFKTEFNSNEQSINFVFQILNFNLYKDVLNDLKNFNDRFQRKLANIKPPQIEQNSPQTGAVSRRRTPSISSRSREGSLDRKTSGKKRSTFKPDNVRLINKKKFVFDFRMHEIAAKLYARQNDIAGGIDPTENSDAILEFCALNIRNFKLNGRMVDDGSMNADISLQAFTMDDRRKNATIHRLMDKKDTKSTDQFVTIKYSQNSHGDKFVDLLSSKFFLMLAPEFLGVLSTFFILKPDDDEDDRKNGPSELFLTPTNNNNSKLALSKQYVSTSSMAKQALTTTKGNPEQSTFEPPGTLTLNCKVYAIEIILIEDSLNPSDSQAIILSFDALLDAKNLNGVQKMDGGIQHFKIYSTYFAKEKRHLSNYQILKEMDIRFNGSIDDTEHSQNFSVKIDQVTLRVSPSIIRLLSAVSAQFSEHQRKDQEAKSARAVLREYQDYWKPRIIENDKYWWFQLGNESGADEIAEEVGESTQIAISQKADFSIKQFIVTVEAGMKDFTRPMILLESTMLGSAKNWSTQLIAEAETRLQISYYNEAFNVWEPLIEPVLHQYEGWQSWRLTLKISSQLEEDQNSQQRQGTSKNNDKNTNKKAVLPPKMALIFEAREMMNITISKSFLQLVNQLSESFEKAAKQISPPKSRYLPGSSNYMLLNETGLKIKVCNTSTLKASQKYSEIDCNDKEYISLELIENEDKNESERQLSAGNWQMKEDQRLVELQLKIEEPKTERIVNILRAEMQCIDLPKEADSGRKWALVVDTQIEDSRHFVVLRSPVNVLNHMDMSVEFRSHKDLETTFCGVSTNDLHNLLNIPLPLLYTPDGDFSVRPEGEIYDWSKEFSWHEFDSVKRKTVRCAKKDNEYDEAIFIELVITEEKIRRGAKSSEYSIFTINLFPPIHFVNMLPLHLEIIEPIQREVTSGEGVDLYNLIAGMPFILKLENSGEVYKMKMNIPQVNQRNDLTVIKLESETSNKKLCLGLNWSIEFLRTTLSLFTPYWMINDTGKELIYQGPLETLNNETPLHTHNLRASIFGECCSSILPKILIKDGGEGQQAKHSEIKHSINQNPIILPLNEEDFYEKKKAKLRISDSEWSAEFPLDSAGSSGRITCHSEKKDYELTVDVKLCQSGLTKVVTISPFYLLQNDSKYCIEVREPNRNEWIFMPQTSVIGFWPEQKEKRKTLIARFLKTKEESIQFPFTENFEGFARVKNSFIGFYIIVSLSDDSSVINIEQFMPGVVPAILMNATNFPIKYWQAEVEEENTLEPGQVIPFAWDCLITKENRLFEWQSVDHFGSDELLHNRDTSYLPSKTAGYHFCVSFLNGRQRVVLFTSDASISMSAHEPFEFEQPNMHVEFRLHGVGISLVNNHKCIEVLYMAIMPGQGQRDGFWMQYRQTDHQTTLWIKLHNFQIDNQLPSSIFPCMLAMVPQPRSVVKDAPKPFLECSFVMNQSEHSNIVQIKLLEALVQEFSVRMDQSLINEILDMFPKESIEVDYNKEAFSKDLELTKGNLNKRALQTRISQAKAYYERLHISPLMIHLSFSQGHVKEGEKGSSAIQWEFLNLMLKSVGVTLTEIQDVTFKLAFFHREAAFYSRTQLQGEIQSHYIKQFIKQAYVLILGLDIIGNPFGLIRDLTAGVQDFFYQPIQGAVTGPLEFVEGMTLGVNSLFSHSVGGVLGAASRITGTLGKGVAALTMDEEYQRKRLQARQTTSIGEGMFRGVRGVGQGVIDGVTGVISKPVEGAKKGGVSGFLKGTGKGLIGVVARPVSGVVDLATSMADSVKTVVTNAEETKPIRPPRVITNDKIVRPFVYTEAIGYRIFKEINKGDFAETECYLSYGSISKHLVFVVTDKRVIEARQHELTGNWNADWSPLYSEMTKPEQINSNDKYGVKISLKEPKRGTFSILGRSKTKGKLILFENEEIAEKVFERMLNAWENSA